MAKHLVLAPHHDDAEFGVGIAIQNWLRRGDEVHVVIAATGSYTRSDGENVDGLHRILESEKSLSHLGVTSITIADWYAENQALSADYVKVVTGIEQQVREFNPTDTYVCLPSFNQDHRVLYDAALTAFRPGGMPGNLHAYEYFGNQWAQQLPAFGRRFHIGTPQAMGMKAGALRMHETQFKGRSGGVDVASAFALASLRGQEIGHAFAELTYVIKEIAP